MRIFFLLLLLLASQAVKSQKTADYWLRRSDSLVQLQQYNEALRLLDSVLWNTSERLAVYKRQLVIYEVLKDYPGAVTVAEYVLRAEPENAALHHQTAWLMMLNRNASSARYHLQRAVDLQPLQPAFYITYSLCEYSLKVPTTAGQLISAAFQLSRHPQQILMDVQKELRQLTARIAFPYDTASLITNLRPLAEYYSSTNTSLSLIDSITQLQSSVREPHHPALVLMKERFIAADRKQEDWRYHTQALYLMDIAEYHLNYGSEEAAFENFRQATEMMSAMDQWDWTLRFFLRLAGATEVPYPALLQPSIELARTKNQGWAQMQALQSLAAAFKQFGLHDSAIHSIRAALQLLPAMSDRDFLLFKKGRKEAAGRLYRELAELYALQQNRDSTIANKKRYTSYAEFDFWEMALFDVFTLIHCSALDEAEKTCKRLMQSSGASPEQQGALFTYAGVIAYYKGDAKSAESHLWQAMELYKSAIKQMSFQYLQATDWPLKFLTRTYLEQRNADMLFRLAEEQKSQILYRRSHGSSLPVGTLDLQQVRQTLAPGAVLLQFSPFHTGEAYVIGATKDTVILHRINDEWVARQLDQPILRKVVSQVLSGGSDYLSRFGLAFHEHFDQVPGIVEILSVQLNERYGKFRGYRGLSIGKKNSATVSQQELDALNRLFYSLYLQPFEALLSGKKQIIISAAEQGGTQTVPFEVLQIPDGDFVGNKYNVSYAPSFTFYQFLRQQTTAGGSKMLAVGNPNFSRYSFNATISSGVDLYRWGIQSWSDLPGTQEELRTIRKLLPGTTILEGSAVSETAIQQLSARGKLREYAWLHFATHGVSPIESYRYMSLVLTDDASKTGADGLLQFDEIAALNINARMVCLSACETGLPSRNLRQLNHYSLATAFFLAGARSVLGSSWKIDDAATAVFMQSVYEKIFKQGLSPSEAVHATKQAFIRGDYRPEWRAPAYWGAFRFMGL